MPSNLKDRFLDKETFYIAFKKLKAQLDLNNAWFNPVELSSYEANLTNNLNRLITEITNETYKPKPLQVLPYPKKSKDGKQRLRQYFRCSIDDQIVWIAIAMVVGETVEKRMPVWSYGNRLFKPIWFENVNGKKVIRKGSLNNTSEHIYRKWTQSWPFYRRHITMTVRILGRSQKFKPEMLDDAKEAEIYSQEKEGGFEYFYLDKDFWRKGEVKKLFWAGLDFKAFFPNINPQAIIDNFRESLSDFTGELKTDTKLIFGLIERMFTYPLDVTGWVNKDDLQGDNTCALKDLTKFSGIPTGLLAGGFLANVAMLDIDRKVDEYVRSKKNVAIFKYVDDHVILSKSNEELFAFLNFYDDLIKKSNTGVSFQTEKMLPDEMLHHSNVGFSLKDASKPDNTVDIDFPKPLITQTLQKMSELNSEEYELKDDFDLENSTADLEHFLLADFPDEEMRRDTRISFAAMKLSQIAKQITPDFKTLTPTLLKLKNFDIAVQKKRTKKTNKERRDLALQFIDELGDQKTKTRKRQLKILKLLLIAVEENPDKLKLWRRCIEVCHISGVGLDLVMGLINKVDLHPEGKKYVHAYLLIVLSDHLITAINQINSPYATFWKTTNAVEFLNDLSHDEMVTEGFKKETFPFCRESVALYQFNKDFVQSDVAVRSIDFAPALKRRDKRLTQIEQVGGLNAIFSKEDYYWNLLDGLNYEQRLMLWRQISNTVNLGLPISWSIVSLFPKFIDRELFDRMISTTLSGAEAPNEYYDLTKDGEGVLLEVFESNESIRNKYLNDYPVFKEYFSAPRGEISPVTQGRLPLHQWLQTIVEKTKTNPWTDIRLSEWTVLEVVKQVAGLLNSRLNDHNPFNKTYHQLYKVHPANYMVPVSWADADSKKLTWSQWEKLTTDDPITLTSENAFIDDFRYFPVREQWRQNYAWFFGNQYIIVIGLSVLATKLISKSFEWPATTNKLTFIDKLFAIATHSIEHQPVSSDTRIMLNQNFSRENMEFLSGFRFASTMNDVTKLSSFIERISKIQKLLTNDHLTLVNHAPRQLTTIDIDKLNAAKSIF